jgi:hypothetical protein
MFLEQKIGRPWGRGGEFAESGLLGPLITHDGFMTTKFVVLCKSKFLTSLHFLAIWPICKIFMGKIAETYEFCPRTEKR